MRIESTRDNDLQHQAALEWEAEQLIASIVTVATPHALEGGHIQYEDYIDFDLLVRTPDQAQDVASRYSRAIQQARQSQHANALAFIQKDYAESSNTVGALQLAALVSTDRRVWLPYVVVRLDKDVPHDRIKFHGDINRSTELRGYDFIVVTDHISHGSEVLDTLHTIRDFGGSTACVVTYTIREDLWEMGPVRPQFAEQGVEVYWLAAARPKRLSLHEGEMQLEWKANSALFRH